MDESAKVDKPPIKRVYDVQKSAGSELRVVRLKGAQTINCQIISDTFWGVTIHFDHRVRRSEPCTGVPDTCPGCQVKKPVKNLYYLHVFSSHHAQCFIELTESAMVRVKELLEGEKTFRGQVIELRRTAADNGRIIVKMSETFAGRANLPKEKDPENTLRYLWEWGRK